VPGPGLIFLFDLYLFSEAVLFGSFDPDAVSIRGAVHALAVPLLLLSTRAAPGLDRQAAGVAHGSVLLGHAAAGRRLPAVHLGHRLLRALLRRRLGPRAAAGLLFVAVVLADAAGLLGRLRAWLRVFVGKHFFSYRYDYREEWLRFTAMLSTRSSPQEMGGLIVRGLADMVESPGGSLWSQSPATRVPRSQVARWNMPRCRRRREPVDSPALPARAQGLGDRPRRVPRHPRALRAPALPPGCWPAPNAWLVVPLLVGDDLLGFVVLARPRTPTMELNWEVRDLLKTAGRQAAGFLAQMQATEALLEARKFDAFNRMSAFVVHDLKNIVTQLSLMLKNAERLHANPEFQQDMLLTVESSLEKMRQLMLQLREGATPPGGRGRRGPQRHRRRLQRDGPSRGRKLEVECRTSCWRPAAMRSGSNGCSAIWCRTPRRHATRAAGSGCGEPLQRPGAGGGGRHRGGMSRSSSAPLFRPSSTTKQRHGHRRLRERAVRARARRQHRGRERTRTGTVMTVLLPLFEARTGSDLLLQARCTGVMSAAKRPPLLIVEDDLALQKQIKWSLDRFESVTPTTARSRWCSCAATTRGGDDGPGLPPDPDSVSEGFKLLEQMLDIDPDTKVIVLTGQNDQANALRAVAMGAYDFLAKPFEPEC
jgi:hypothetical protein